MSVRSRSSLMQGVPRRGAVLSLRFTGSSQAAPDADAAKPAPAGVVVDDIGSGVAGPGSKEPAPVEPSRPCAPTGCSASADDYPLVPVPMVAHVRLHGLDAGRWRLWGSRQLGRRRLRVRTVRLPVHHLTGNPRMSSTIIRPCFRRLNSQHSNADLEERKASCPDSSAAGSPVAFY